MLDLRHRALVCIAGSALSACTSRADISLIGIEPSGWSSADFVQVTTAKPYDFGPTEDEVLMVIVAADRDLTKIVTDRGMDHLYYRLRTCSDGSDLYSSSAMVRKGEAGSGTLTYYAPVPIAYNEAFDQYADVFTHEPISDTGRVCVGLGAGSIAGASLVTNYVHLPLSDLVARRSQAQ